MHKSISHEHLPHDSDLTILILLHSTHHKLAVQLYWHASPHSVRLGLHRVVSDTVQPQVPQC